VQNTKVLPGVEGFPSQPFTNPGPGHKASDAVWHTVAEAALQQVLQLVSWKTNIIKTFNVNMSVFNCWETCSYLPSSDSSSPQSTGQGSLHHCWRVSALHVILTDLYQRKERSVISLLTQMQGHSLWEVLGLWIFLKILLSPMLVTSGYSSWETWDTQHKQFGCTESTCTCRKPDTMDIRSALSPSSSSVRVQIETIFMVPSNPYHSMILWMIRFKTWVWMTFAH